MRSTVALLIIFSLLFYTVGCGNTGDHKSTAGGGTGSDTHTHADGTTHSDHAGTHDHDHDHDHAHEEVDLEPITINGMRIELAQSHGSITAGEEGHLVVKLPYNDSGSTVVRAWIGGPDRTMSMVGLGVYAPSHDDYDIHAMAPDPLPAETMWWIEIEKPDGTKVVGSAEPMMNAGHDGDQDRNHSHD